MNEKSLIEENLDGTISNKKKLWNPKIFLVISILFSFLPAAILYSLNYGRVGYKRKRNIYLIVSVLGFILMIIALIFIPSTIAKSIALGINVGIGVYLKNDQEKLFKQHIDNGGKKASYLVPLLICFVVLGAFIALSVYLAFIPENSVTIHGDEVYYTERVEKEEAEKLANYLSDTEFLMEDDISVAVKIDKSTEGYIFSFIIDEQYLEDEEIIQSVQELADYLSIDVFNGEKVEVEMCNEVFKPMKVISSNK
ncbi:hypothetical protein [Oceanirhabdus sp. W0125-5]|uniref:hypothetical protein n=1 Tax=Oceanirhabdus sp. W0125-5 TaxID=2999116 RepID=UPI0022F31573|nr:hypothetical protein [Oceanirhabdus sp. W0125-5]WBW97086.1 hypothetical protein OW730_25860 [Oceanirhabdus sp. W0125-5]